MNAKTWAIAAMAGAIVLSTGCRREPDETPAVTEATAPPAAAPATDATAAGTVASDTRTAPDASGAAPIAATQGAALALVGVVDEHEVAAAEQARAKKVTGPVLEYANLLHREHGANLEAGRQLASGSDAIQPERTAEVNAMSEKGKSELATLDQKSGKDYEKAYVDAMVKGHTEALAMLEERLIPAAQDEKLRNFLTNTRDHVAMHLQRGKDLQASGR